LDLEKTVNEVATKIIGNSAQTIAAMKSLYYFGANHGLAKGLEYEWQTEIVITDREDFLRNFATNK
jgi:enoyl-CoA hydratase/carnithine racemase